MSEDTVHVYKDEHGEWRWRRTSPNGNVLADSGEGYVRRIDCVNMAIDINGDKVILHIDGKDELL